MKRLTAQVADWLDEWFEGLWLDAAADAGYGLHNEIDFDRSMRSEERSGQ